MEFLKFFIFFALVIAATLALPSPATEAIEKLKSGVKKPLVRFPVGHEGLTRARRQFGGGFGGASSYASANSGAYGLGGSPYGYGGFPGIGYGGSSAYSSASAGSGAFGR